MIFFQPWIWDDVPTLNESLPGPGKPDTRIVLYIRQGSKEHACAQTLEAFACDTRVPEERLSDQIVAGIGSFKYPLAFLRLYYPWKLWCILDDPRIQAFSVSGLTPLRFVPLVASTGWNGSAWEPWARSTKFKEVGEDGDDQFPDIYHASHKLCTITCRT